MKTKLAGLMICLALTATFSGQAKPLPESDAKLKDAVTTLWTMPTASDSVTLMALGESKPVTVAVNPDTVFGGICHDCNLPLRFKPAGAGKKCETCGCDVSDAECIVWGKLKANTWEGMLVALPPGTGLRAIYNMANTPGSGLKSLIVDRRAVLLPVEGLGARTKEELLLLVKPLGGVSAEVTGGGKQLSIALKDDWTAAKEIRLEKALASLGAKVTYPVAETAKP